MKKSLKKTLGIGFGVLAAAAIVPALAVTLTSCGSSSNNKAPANFYNALNDPYKELNMFAATLDAANEQYSNPTTAGGSISSNTVSSGTNAGTNNNAHARVGIENSNSTASFSDAAKKINKIVQNFVISLANNQSIKQFTDKNDTVLFVKNDDLKWTNGSETEKQHANQFQIEQPILYSQIYSTPSVTECPGFGFKFPTPRNNDANKLFDDWFEIGASAQSSGKNDSIVSKLTSAFSGTADFVFYLYDSKNFASQDEVNNFVNYVYSQKVGEDSSFNPGRLVKSDSPVKHVIPLDIEWMYNGNWDIMGQYIMDYLFALIFANVNKDGGINKFYNPNFKDETENEFLKTANSEASNEIYNIAKATQWNPEIATKNLKTIRPNVNSLTKEEKEVYSRGNGENVNFMTTMFNTTGLSLALGIAPDKITKFDEDATNSAYHNLSLYLSTYADKITKANGDASNTFVTNSSNNFTTLLDTNKVYALADNRDSFGKGLNAGDQELAPWPLTTNSGDNSSEPTTNPGSIETQNFKVELQHEQIGTTSAVRNHCIPVYTERNDTEYTQYGVADNKDFNLQLWDSVNNKAITYTDWMNEFKN